MAYNNNFPVSYQPIGYTQPYQANYNMQPATQPVLNNTQTANTQSNNSGIVWVQGEAGAKSYLVGAGNSVMLMDSEQSVFYIKSTDQSGMPLPLRIFDYTERTETPHTPSNLASNATLDANKFVTYEALENRLQQIIANNSRRSTKRKEDVVDNGE